MMCIKHSFVTLSSCLMLLGVGMTGLSQAAGVPDAPPFQGDAGALAIQAQMASTTNRIIVKYRQPTAGAAAFRALSRQVSQTSGHNMAHVGSSGTGAQIFKLEQPLPLEDVQKTIREIEADPDVEFAEPDKRVFPVYVPTDPRYNEQWQYHENTVGSRLPIAWDFTKGEGVTVAVLDSGYTEHADLLANLQLPGYDLISDIDMSNDGDGQDADAHDPGDKSPECGFNSSSWHGTHIAGTVAAVGDNGIGVVGVAYKAKVQPVRVLGKCGGWLSELADGIVWASGATLSGVPDNPTPAKVISVSMGGDSKRCSRTMQAAINTAREQGSTVLVAAGNESKDASGFEPANCDGVIVVAATDMDGNRAFFSNYGNRVDIAAPGMMILSTMNSGDDAPESDTYAQRMGTSMATPQVSGVAAMLYSIKPNITPDEVEQTLKDTARPFRESCDGCGVGMLDAAAAVAAASGVKSPAPESVSEPVPAPAPSGSFSYSFCSQEDQICSFSGTRVIRYGANGFYSYQIASESVICSNDTFGDPINSATKSCYISEEVDDNTLSYTDCSGEGQSCSFSGTRIVRYGSSDAYSYKLASNGTACSNDVFGDPGPYHYKSCSYSEEVGRNSLSYTPCSGEGQNCSFTGTRVIRYGFNGTYKYGIASNGTECSNDVFGDPGPFHYKSCSYSSKEVGSDSLSYSYCSSEGQNCSFSGRRVVLYGAKGYYTYQVASDSISCTNDVFSDPLPYAGKTCWYSAEIVGK